jgi:hypothetical protein
MMSSNGERRRVGRRVRAAAPDRESFTFVLDPGLVERARREVGERDMVRSIEAALLAAIDYQLWVREVSRGKESA